MNELPPTLAFHNDPDLARCLLDSLEENELLAVIDSASRVIRSLNPALALCAGRDAASCLNQPLDSLIELDADDKAAIARTAASRVASQRLLSLRRPDGCERRLRTSLLAVRNAAGDVASVLLRALDVTFEELALEELRGKSAAIDRTQAVIEFDLHGRILHANDNFLALTGYQLAEVEGRHHSMFCDPEHTASEGYAALWQRLRAGQPASGEFRRLGKGGKAVWIRAAYNPILDLAGQPYKVVKYALDVTAAKLVAADHAGQMRAINRAQAVVEFGFDGVILDANDNFLALMGYTRAEVVGRHHRMFCEADYADSAEYRHFWTRLGEGEFDAAEYKRLGKGGREIWINATYNPVFDIDGKPVKVVKFATDVTPLKQAQARQAQVESRLRGITDQLPALISHVDADERYDFLNATFERWLGQGMAASLGRRMCDVMAPAVYAKRRDLIKRCLAGESLTFESEQDLLVGRRVLRIQYEPDVGPDGSVVGFYTFSFDVTELREAQRSLNQLVRSDNLTGLPNRYQFNETLPLALARCARSGLALALMFIDIDHFKLINDSWGHAAGDAVLKEFARRLQRSVRSTDLAARLGGDEFVVVLEVLHDETESHTVARKILAEMARPFDIEGRMLTVTASVGIAFQADAGVGSAEVLALADTALYRAKADGRNTYRMAAQCAPSVVT